MLIAENSRTRSTPNGPVTIVAVGLFSILMGATGCNREAPCFEPAPGLANTLPRPQDVANGSEVPTRLCHPPTIQGDDQI